MRSDRPLSMCHLIVAAFLVFFLHPSDAVAQDRTGSARTVLYDRNAPASGAYQSVPLRPVTRLSLDVETGDETGGDWDGLKRDTLYFGFTQMAVIAALYVSPQSISGWSAADKDRPIFEKYRSNIRHVVWDTDDWWINYLLHPYWGGTYYVRAAERGYGKAPAFWYSVALSTMYEFGAEAMFEKPSIQDLIFTPGLGYFVGDYFMGVRQGIRMRVWSGESLTGTDRTILFLTDPLGSVNRGINSLFGWDVEVSVEPIVTVSAPPDGAGSFASGHAFDAERTQSVVSGIRMRVTW